MLVSILNSYAIQNARLILCAVYKPVHQLVYFTHAVTIYISVDIRFRFIPYKENITPQSFLLKEKNMVNTSRVLLHSDQ